MATSRGTFSKIDCRGVNSEQSDSTAADPTPAEPHPQATALLGQRTTNTYDLGLLRHGIRVDVNKKLADMPASEHLDERWPERCHALLDLFGHEDLTTE